MRRALLALLCLAASAPAAAQPDDGYEDFLRTVGVLGIASEDFAHAQIAIVDLSTAPEIGGASFRSENGAPGLDFDSLRLPFSITRPVARLDADLVLDFALSTQGVDEDAFALLPDLFPEREAVLAGSWRAYSGFVGAGLRWPLGDTDVSVRPLLGLSSARIADRTEVGGADAAIVREAFDGTLLDWSVWTLAAVPAVELAYERRRAVHVRVATRVSYHMTRTLARDGFLELSSDDPLASARVDLGGDFPFTLGRFGLGWRLNAGTQHLLGDLGEALPFDRYHDFGAALALGIGHLGLGAENVLVRGVVITGPDLSGWGLGFGLEL